MTLLPIRLRPAPFLAVLFATGLVALPAAASEVYQWKDANGVVHYSDTPPPPGADHSTRYISDSGRASRAQDPKAAAPEENEACLAARSNLEVLRGEQPVGRDTDGDGEPDAMLEPAQRQAQLQLAEATIRVHCKGAVPAG